MTSSAEMEANVIHAAGKTRFMRRMRFHQSWYRKHKLECQAGTNPYAADTTAPYGSRLRPNAARSGKNFLTSKIFSAVKDRLAENRGSVNEQDQPRLLYDLLSSQPMCFNLFGPLVNDLGLATRLVRGLPGVPRDIQVTNVAIEFAPDRKRHLDDATSHDAFVEYERRDGGRGFIGIETKLTEPFSPDRYPFEERYSRWKKADWWWRSGAEEHFPDPKFNQLWRNHLLTFSMLKQEPPAYSEAFAAVLYHDEDKSCSEAMNTYRSHLLPKGQDTLLGWPLSIVLETWEDLLETAQQRSWFAAFRLRYWDLEASKLAWDQFNEKT